MKVRIRTQHEGCGRCRSAALLIVLLALSLMTIIVLGLLGTMAFEMSSSRSDYETRRAQALATLGLNTAVAQIDLPPAETAPASAPAQ